MSIQGVLGLWNLLDRCCPRAWSCLPHPCASAGAAGTIHSKSRIVPRAASVPGPMHITVGGRKGGEPWGKWGPGMSCCPCQSCLSPAGTSERVLRSGGCTGEFPAERDSVTDRCQGDPSLQVRVPLEISPKSEQVLIKLLFDSVIFGFPSPLLSWSHCGLEGWSHRAPSTCSAASKALCFHTKHFRDHCTAFGTLGNVIPNGLR